MQRFRVPKISWPYKGPQLPTHKLGVQVEGWYRVKMTPEQRRRQVHKQARLRKAIQRDMAGGQPGAEELGMHSEETDGADKFAAEECFRGDS